MNKINRRHFLKNSGVLAITAFLGAKLLTWGQAAYAQALKLVDMTKTKRKDPENDQAVAILTGMGYVSDAKKGNRTDKTFPDGKVFPAKNQYCTNCILIEEADLNTNKPGKCKLVQTALVDGHGYCNTYNVSPKAKV